MKNYFKIILLTIVVLILGGTIAVKAVEKKLFPMLPDKIFHKALFDAILSNKVEGVNWALNQMTNINVKDKNGRYPLFYAIREGKLEIVKLLLAYGADTKNVTDNFKDALSTAIYYYDRVNGDSLDIIKLLLKYNVDINVPGDNGDTSLHLAVMRNYPEIVKLLVSNRADINMKNKEGKTPFAIAQDDENVAIIAILDAERLKREKQTIEQKRLMDHLIQHNTLNLEKILQYGESRK